MLLSKGVNPYEYMNNCEKFSETIITKKEDFYSRLNMEDISDADYAHVKRFCKDFKISNSGDSHDLQVDSNALLLLDIFEKLSKYVS